MANWVNRLTYRLAFTRGLFSVHFFSHSLRGPVRTGSPWELLYADDLVIVSDSLADLQRKFDAWKSGMEDKGLRVNVGKTKLMVSGPNLNLIHDYGKHPWGYADKELVATRSMEKRDGP